MVILVSLLLWLLVGHQSASNSVGSLEPQTLKYQYLPNDWTGWENGAPIGASVLILLVYTLFFHSWTIGIGYLHSHSYVPFNEINIEMALVCSNCHKNWGICLEFDSFCLEGISFYYFFFPIESIEFLSCIDKYD